MKHTQAWQNAVGSNDPGYSVLSHLVYGQLTLAGEEDWDRTFPVMRVASLGRTEGAIMRANIVLFNYRVFDYVVGTIAVNAALDD